MRRGTMRLQAGLAALLAAVAPGAAKAATLAELVGWCAPDAEPGSDRLCSSYLDVIFQGLASTDTIMNGGNRMCVPADADRGEIVRLVRAYAAKNAKAREQAALDGVGAALKGRYPCR